MIVHIPTAGLEHEDTVTSTMDGTDYILLFLWNARNFHWYFRIEDSEENVLLGDTKICADTPLLAHRANDDLPPGELWCLTPDGVDPGLLSWGDGAELYYIEEGSIT